MIYCGLCLIYYIVLSLSIYVEQTCNTMLLNIVSARLKFVCDVLWGGSFSRTLATWKCTVYSGAHFKFHGLLIALGRPVLVINWPLLTIATQDSTRIPWHTLTTPYYRYTGNQKYILAYLGIADENHSINLVGLFPLLQNQDWVQNQK